MPDFFEGTYAKVSWFPADTDEKMGKVKNFMSTAADPAKTVSRVPKVVQEVEEKVKKFGDDGGWGVMGYCWGGKVKYIYSFIHSFPSLLLMNSCPFRSSQSLICYC